MEKRVTVEEVAKQFAALQFDDTRNKQHCKSLLVKFLGEPPRKDEHDAIKQVMIQNLNSFVAIIDQHHQTEFMALPETFDSKYNHHHVLFWIVVTDYNGVQDQSKFPTWYPGLSRLMNWNADCKTVTLAMIDYLKNAK